MILRTIWPAGAIIAAGLAAGCSPTAGSPSPDALAPTRTVDLTYTFVVSDLPSKASELRLWVPLPAENGQQGVRDLAFSGAASFDIRLDHEYGNRFLTATLPLAEGAGGERSFTLTATVQRHAVDVLGRPPAAGRPAPKHLERFLRPDRLVPIDGAIAAEARRVAGDAGTARQRARRLYDHVVQTMSYDKSGTGWGQGDALYACDIRTGNCTDFHSLFIGEARALGIPARFVMGLPLPPGTESGTIPGYHCWAEFYLDEWGWVPIDASEAHKHPEHVETFFGGLDSHRIEFTRGRDIALPGAVGEPLNYSIYPHVEVDGQVHSQVETEFSFRAHEST
ncbi:MAG: transglutaminase-like domain-containing protein [Acidobacteria bacterium]|nr:transglutaminase-like domain-containing protein [Acidobacteriota bacterium]